MKVEKLSDKATKSQRVKTIQGLAGRIAHVETLVNSPKLLPKFAEFEKRLEEQAGLIADLKMRLNDAIARIHTLEQQANQIPVIPPIADTPLVTEPLPEVTIEPAVEPTTTGGAHSGS